MNDNPATRAEAFADWLGSIPSSPPFYTRPDYAPFADMTDDEMEAAESILAERAAALQSERAKLRDTRKERYG